MTPRRPVDHEPDDSERTVVRPSERGRAALSAASLAVPAAQAVDAPILATPLAAAATPLLQLLARLPAVTRPPDPTDLRERVVREIRGFERRAREGAIGMEILRPAHYVLCASIDDVVLNSAWGAASEWRLRTLVSTFHQDNNGDRGFFGLLARMREDPARFLPVIELGYLCLSLGFMGRFRSEPSRSEALRRELCALIVDQRLARGSPAAPSPFAVKRSVGGLGRVPVGRVPVGRVPIWLAAVVALALFGAGYLGVSVSLSMASDRTRTRLLNAPPDRMPSIARPA
jgi:type VI secretion system protein ImpK